MRPLGYQDHETETQDRAAQKNEERSERQSQWGMAVDGMPSGLTRFGGLKPEDAEFETVALFAEFLEDNDRKEFTHCELACVNARTRMPVPTIRATLEAYGFKLKAREFEKTVRGFTANPNAGRYDGMHGGGGGSSINGFAGQVG